MIDVYGELSKIFGYQMGPGSSGQPQNFADLLPPTSMGGGQSGGQRGGMQLTGTIQGTISGGDIMGGQQQNQGGIGYRPPVNSQPNTGGGLFAPMQNIGQPNNDQFNQMFGDFLQPKQTMAPPQVQPAMAPTQPAVTPTQPTMAPTQPAVTPTQPTMAPTQPTMGENLYGPTTPVQQSTTPELSPNWMDDVMAGVQQARAAEAARSQNPYNMPQELYEQMLAHNERVKQTGFDTFDIKPWQPYLQVNQHGVQQARAAEAARYLQASVATMPLDSQPRLEGLDNLKLNSLDLNQLYNPTEAQAVFRDTQHRPPDPNLTKRINNINNRKQEFLTQLENSSYYNDYLAGQQQLQDFYNTNKQFTSSGPIWDNGNARFETPATFDDWKNSGYGWTGGDNNEFNNLKQYGNFGDYLLSIAPQNMNTDDQRLSNYYKLDKLYRNTLSGNYNQEQFLHEPFGGLDNLKLAYELGSNNNKIRQITNKTEQMYPSFDDWLETTLNVNYKTY